MADSLSERDCQQVVSGETHSQCSDLTVGLSPLAFVIQHAAAGRCVMEAVGMAAKPAQELWEN